jgi:hypothetical protein
VSRRAHQPTPEQRKTVEAMAGYGIPHEEIGRVVGVSVPTLHKCYRQELDNGHTKANAAVAQNLFKIATGPGREAVTAAIFWLKVRAGWHEYSPPHVSVEKLGKKAQQIEDAKHPDTGNKMGELMARRAQMPLN